MTPFSILGRYFWLVCLAITAANYVKGIRSLSTKTPTDPRASAEAIALRRWIAVGSALPWAVMGWAILMGGVPNIWYFFRPQDRNPYVLAWFATLFGLALYFAYWVFFCGGAEKVVRLQPVEVRWHRTTLRGTTRGTFAITEGRVKLFAAIGPLWFALWIVLASSMNVPLPK